MLTLLSRSATPEQPTLGDVVKLADVVVAAIGQGLDFVKGDWLKPGAIVIDVGTNYIPDSATKKSGQRLSG